MPLTPGTKLGPYEIVSALGAGGMGEVYRARDTRLERTVALKILEPGLSADGERMRRFEQEARAASALHHANIVAIFDVGQQNGTSYLVMELVEGRTLRDLLVAPLPLKKALAIGAQIADALAKAHAAGIVHRDLKPENIMVASDGLVKVLDFGVAKLAGSVPSGSGTTATAAASGTQPGVVLGTVGYMSPEQARAAAVDFRSDQFALGTVLYEMLTGKRPFQRESSAQTLAAIIEDEPAPISDLNPKVPAPVRWIVERCLAKETEERYASTRDLARDLQRARDYLSEPTSTTAGIHAPPAKARVKRVAGMAFALVAAALIAFFAGYRFSRQDGAQAPTYRAALLPPPGHSFVAYDFSISPDGTKLAYTATSADGVTTLWVKSLQSGSDQEFSRTESAGYPFWSPDGRQLGFFAVGKLKKVELATGAVQTVCDAVVGRGGAWSPNGTIVFSPAVGLALERVPATGGTPAPATVVPQGMSESHRWPTFLPDGRNFLFFVDFSETRDGLYVGSVDGSETKLISKQIRGNVEFGAGHLLFVRDGSLYAQRFDTERLELTGTPVPIVNQELEQVMGFSKSGFTVSATGALVYQSRHSYSSRLTWFDRSGKELGSVGERGAFQPSLSPDGRFLTAILDSENNGRHRVQVVDLARGTSTSITPASDQQISAAAWSPDGTEVLYSASMYTEKGRTSELRRVPADGSGRDKVLFRAARLMVNDWSRNGRYLAFMNFEKGPPELWIYDMETSQALGVGFQSAEGQFSPDGRWLSHIVGARDSRPQVFVRSFPEMTSRVQISTTGGSQSRWRPDGKELYYIADDKRLMAVSLKVGQKGLEAGPPTPLFQTRIHGKRYALFQYAVSADGQRFLINSLPREDAAAPMVLLTDWTSEIRR